MTRADRTLEVVRRVVEALQTRGIESALIGAAAMAFHNYARATEDIDLATRVDPFGALREVEKDLRGAGLDAVLNLPDSDDPLGGVLRIAGDDFDTVDVVNYLNPFRRGADALAAEAIASAVTADSFPFELRVVDVAYLAALKLYAGGMKSAADVVELLNRNADRVSFEDVRTVCARFGLEPDLQRLRPHFRSRDA